MPADTAFLGLAQNAALLLAVAFVYDATTSRFQVRQGLAMQVAIGLLLGILGCLLMLSPWTYVPGIVFDTRSVLLSVSGLFFGTVPTAVAMAMTSLLRLQQGGAAAWAGVAVILATGSLGIAWRHARRSPLEKITWPELYCLGLVAHGLMLALMFILPWETAVAVLANISLPVLTIYPVATALLGVLMVNRLRRENLATRLQASEERMRIFKVLVENASDAIGMATLAGTHFYQNEAFTRLFGDVGADPPATIYVDTAQGREVFRRVMAGGRWEGEVKMYARDRRVVHVFLRAYANRDSNGEIISLVGIHTDISERVEVARALRESEERYRTLVNNLPGLAYRRLCDESWTMVFFSEGIQGMTGYPATDFIDNAVRSYASIIHPEDRATVDRAVQEGIGTHRPYEMEYRLVRADGAFIRVYEKGRGIFDSQGKLLWLDGVIVDITEQRQVQEEKERLQIQLLQAQKMESIGRLAGGVAHDFNNMLQTILGYCDITLRTLAPDPENPLHENLSEIRRAAERSADLTRQLLAFARKQTVSPKVLDLNDTVAGMLKMLQRLIGENIELAWLPGHDLWPVKIDPSQLDQVLANLAVNARDAIADTGRITIATENIRLGETFCSDHPDFLPGDHVLLTVSDNGNGMDEGTMAQIFEPFFTTKDQGKGTGLGLATVYGIVRQNHGNLTVESAPGQGTIFRIYLPSSAAEQQPALLPARKAVFQEGGNETVLLVEDEEGILKFGRTALEMSGYTVLAAQTPAGALALAREHPGPIHLLLTDVVMPEMNGRDLAQQLTAIRPDLKCLYMSGYTADIIARHGVLESDVHFLQKPFSLDELFRAIRRALRESA